MNEGWIDYDGLRVGNDIDIDDDDEDDLSFSLRKGLLMLVVLVLALILVLVLLFLLTLLPSTFFPISSMFPSLLLLPTVLHYIFSTSLAMSLTTTNYYYYNSTVLLLAILFPYSLILSLSTTTTLGSLLLVSVSEWSDSCSLSSARIFSVLIIDLDELCPSSSDS